MKKSLKMEKRNKKRQEAFDAKMADARISQTFKSSANRPGGDKRK